MNLQDRTKPPDVPLIYRHAGWDPHIRDQYDACMHTILVALETATGCLTGSVDRDLANHLLADLVVWVESNDGEGDLEITDDGRRVLRRPSTVIRALARDIESRRLAVA